MSIIYIHQENDLPDDIYLCSRCEQMVETEYCPNCGQQAAKIHRNTANNVLWSENISRLEAWVKGRRIIPKFDPE